MKLRFTPTFHEDYHRLPSAIRKTLEKKFQLFRQDTRHPSLRVKKMEGYAGIWEARITEGYRFTFQKEKYGYLLRRVGPHDILRNP